MSGKRHPHAGVWRKPLAAAFLAAMCLAVAGSGCRRRDAAPSPDTAPSGAAPATLTPSSAPGGEDNAASTGTAKENPGEIKPPVAPFALDQGVLTIKMRPQAVEDSDAVVKAISGKIVAVQPPPANFWASWKLDPEQNAIAIRVSHSALKEASKPYMIRVTGRDGAGRDIIATLALKVTELVDPLVLDVEDNEIEVTVDHNADTHTPVKARTGTIIGVLPAPAKSKVTWKFEPDKRAIDIVVAKDATLADVQDYEIVVNGKQTAVADKGAPKAPPCRLRVKVVPAPLILDDYGILEVKASTTRDTDVLVKAVSGTLTGVVPPPPGTSNTIGFGESLGGGYSQAPQYALTWMGAGTMPTYWDCQSPPQYFMYSSLHPGVVNFAFCDGSVRPVTTTPAANPADTYYNPPAAINTPRWTAFQLLAGINDNQAPDFSQLGLNSP